MHTRGKADKLLCTIYQSEDEELVCSEFFDRLPHYVEQELSGAKVETLYPGVVLHIRQCTECAEVYRALREMLALENIDTHRMNQLM
jgi:hypothetical protein